LTFCCEWYRLPSTTAGKRVRERERIERLRGFEALCRRRGLPLTVQRRTILEAVLESDTHPTADAVYQVVRERVPAVSRTTVYRVLDTLVELGVIRQVQQTGTAARFDGNTRRHHHLICSLCGRMADLEAPELDQLPLPGGNPKGFRIDDYTVQFLGICAACRKAEDR